MNNQLVDAYCEAARQLLAEMAGMAGKDDEVDAAVLERLRGVSSAVMSLSAGLRMRSPAMVYQPPAQPS